MSRLLERVLLTVGGSVTTVALLVLLGQTPQLATGVPVGLPVLDGLDGGNAFPLVSPSHQDESKVTQTQVAQKEIVIIDGVTPSRALQSSEFVEEANNLMVVNLKADKRALMVDAVLNDKAFGTFIVDTGATYTSITQEMADEMGIDTNTGKTVAITTANGRIRVPKVVIDRIRINGVEARNVEATVINVHSNSSFAGLLGLSFIRKFKMTIDPQQDRLLFQALSTPADNDPRISRGKGVSEG